MARLFTHTDLLAKHAQLRGVVSTISKEATAVRKHAKAFRDEAEKLYADLPKTARKNMVDSHVKARVQKTAQPAIDKVLPMLKQMEAHRIDLAEAADIMTNPISYANAVTIGNPKLLEQRAAASVMFANMGPAALRVAAESAKTSGDVGMIAALVDRNDQLPASDRPFSNAELVKDVKLPGFVDVQAVFAEVNLLPDYAIACSRALEKGGDISPNDRVRIGLSESKINIQEDGSLAAFQTTEPPRYKLDGTEYVQPDKPKPADGEPVKATDYDTYEDFLSAGGHFTDFTYEDAQRWQSNESGTEEAA